MNPIVDVIIPTYKRPTYLKRAIESVLRQSYKQVNIIVVDDNNADDIYRKMTESLMEGYKENKRVRYIKHLSNLNGAAARNTGIKNSFADYVAFLDDDDFFLPEKIERQVNVLKNLGPEYGGCCCFHIRRYKRFAYKAHTVDSDQSGDYRFDFLSGRTSTPSSTILIRSDVFNTIGGFDESFERHQDLEFLMRFYRSFKMGVSPFFDVYMQVEGFRNYPDSHTAFRIKKQFLSKYSVDIDRFSEKKKALIFKHQWFEVACIYLKERRVKEARLLFSKYVFIVDVSWIDYVKVFVFLAFGIIPITRKFSAIFLGITKYYRFSGAVDSQSGNFIR